MTFPQSEEELRAAEYRRMAQAREDFKLAQELALAGSTDARKALQRNWDAVIPDTGWDPIVKVNPDD